MNLKKILTWGAVGLVIYFVVAAPTHAGTVVNHGISKSGEAADHVIVFLQSIFK